VYLKSLQLSPQQAEPFWMQMIRFVELQIVFLKTRNPKITSLSHMSLLSEKKILNGVLKLVSLSVEIPEKREIFPL